MENINSGSLFSSPLSLLPPSEKECIAINNAASRDNTAGQMAWLHSVELCELGHLLKHELGTSFPIYKEEIQVVTSLLGCYWDKMKRLLAQVTVLYISAVITDWILAY